ncbi:MAG: hypothetical protein AAFV71_14320 [Cyanobacteria bacterium J06633_8]
MTPQEKNIAWAEKVDELGNNLFAGRELTREEFLKLGNYYLSGKYLIRHLEIVRKEKQKASQELMELEAAEKMILQRIEKQNISLESNQ